MKNGDVNAIKNINRKITYRFLLDGEELPLSDIMDNPTITYDCGLEQYSVGNLYIGELSFSVKNTVFVNYKSKIVIEIQQIDSYTYYTNYIGTFYVSTVEEQGLTKRIKAYDELFTLNVGYFPSAKHTSTKAIMEDIARKHYIIINQNGVGLDEIFKWTHEDVAINNEQLEGKTVLEMLSLVAGVYGGSFFVDGYGFLKLTQPTLATSNVTFTQSEYSVPTLDDTTTYNITKLRVIYGEQTTNDDGSIKDTGYYEVGSGTDTHTLAISNPLLKGKQAQAQAILNQIKAMNGYKRFDTTILLGDYRLEPMDVITYVKGDTSYKVPIIYMQFGLTHKGLTVKTQSPTIAESKKEFSFKGTITQKIDNVYTEVMQVKDIVANTITVNELEAINAKIENLQATDATITNLVAGKADIKDLNATNATIENLKATDAEITNLVANKADIKDLNATNATIDNLQADVADINTLLAGNITSGNIQSGSITSDKLVIDDGFIKDAMIDTISANKILAGRLDTGAITIGSEDGKMIIADETIQISDGTNVRVQIGETANGDYALVIWDENGEVMFDATGITEHAIKDAIIKDDMVSDNANINAQKIDITSLFTVINEDGSHTLNGSKIFLDTQQQTLNVAFNSMTTKQDELEEKTDTLTTELTVQSGQIETLIKNTTITDNGQEVLLKDKVSSITQDINGITAKVETVESNVTDLSQRVASAELKITEDAIVSTVTNSQVFKDSVASIDSNTNIGGKNLIKKSRDLSESVLKNNEENNCQIIDDIALDESFNMYKAKVHYYDDYSVVPPSTFLILPLYSKTKSLYQELTFSFEYAMESRNARYYPKCTVHLGSANSSDLQSFIDQNSYIASFGGSHDTDSYNGKTIEVFEEKGTWESEYKELDINNETKKWMRVYTTFIPQWDDYFASNHDVYVMVLEIQGINLRISDDVYFYVRKPKLEVGNKPTSWSQAPEDLEEDVAEEFEITYTKIEQNAENITLTAGRTDANEQAISSLQVNADSINASVKEVTTTIDSITGELNTLTNKVEATMSSEDIKFLVSSEVANSSVGKVTTETGFTFDKDGLTISKSDSEMSTLVDEDGMTIYKNNEVMLDVNNQGVDAQNIKVGTYLIVGNNSRFENYGQFRTGCFFIGQTTATTSEEEE